MSVLSWLKNMSCFGLLLRPFIFRDRQCSMRKNKEGVKCILIYFNFSFCCAFIFLAFFLTPI